MTRLLLAPGARSRPGWPCGAPLRVKASPAVAPCVAAAGARIRARHGPRRGRRDGSDRGADSASGADVVVAADQELNRVIESGATSPEPRHGRGQDPLGAGAPGRLERRRRGSARPDDGSVVRILGGVVSREALRVSRSRARLRPALAREREPRGAALRLAPGRAGDRPAEPRRRAARIEPRRPAAHGPRARRAREPAAGRRAYLPRFPARARQGNAAFRACGRAAAR